MLPRNQDDPVTGQRRRNHLVVMALLAALVDFQIEHGAQRRQCFVGPLTGTRLVVAAALRVGCEQMARRCQRRPRPPGRRKQRDQRTGALPADGDEVLGPLLAGNVADLIDPEILLPGILVGPLGMADDHDLGGAHRCPLSVARPSVA
jgi:hypothetical protein